MFSEDNLWGKIQRLMLQGYNASEKISLTDESMSRTEEIFDKVINALMESKLISQSIQEVIAEDNLPFEVICFTEYS